MSFVFTTIVLALKWLCTLGLIHFILILLLVQYYCSINIAQTTFQRPISDQVRCSNPDQTLHRDQTWTKHLALDLVYRINKIIIKYDFVCYIYSELICKLIFSTFICVRLCSCRKTQATSWRIPPHSGAVLSPTS
jgi:hypothetical protein